MHSIKYSNEAQTDLSDAISHIADESKLNALDYLTRYEKKIELLRLNPFMGVECKSKLIKRDCRVLIHESHVIVYNIIKDANMILMSHLQIQPSNQASTS